jgi:alpha-tubulin suppressor-like RCC1 family protein
VTAVSASNGAFAAVKKNGKVSCWGEESWGGYGCSDLSDISTIYSTAYAFAALTSTGEVKAWGSPDYGGYLPSATLYDIDTIYSNDFAFVAVVRETGTIQAWGSSDSGGANAPYLTNVKTIYNTMYAFCSMFSLSFFSCCDVSLSLSLLSIYCCLLAFSDTT